MPNQPFSALPPPGPERDDILARVRARRLVAGMDLEPLPDTPEGRRIEARMQPHLDEARARRDAKERGRQP